MSEPLTDQTDAPTGEPETPVDDAKTFDAEYVTKLRAEAAEARTKAKEASTRGDTLAELLLTRSIEAATAGVLHDPSDLPRDGDYFADDGSPDLDKIKAAAEALAETKPYLATVRGDVAQGAKEPNPAPSFGELMRLAMR
jgi:hypothetical protein